MKKVRFSELLILYIVLVVVIGSSLSAFGCRTFMPGKAGNTKGDQCSECVVIDLDDKAVVNYLDYVPVIISIFPLTVFIGLAKPMLLPLPTGLLAKPLLPPPRFI